MLASRESDSEFALDDHAQEPDICRKLLVDGQLDEILTEIRRFDESADWLAAFINMVTQAAAVASREVAVREANEKSVRYGRLLSLLNQVNGLLAQDPAFSIPVFKDRIADTVMRQMPSLLPTYQSRLRGMLGPSLPTYVEIVEDLTQHVRLLIDTARLASGGTSVSFDEMDWPLIFGEQLSRFAFAQYGEALSCRTIAQVASAVYGQPVREDLYIRWFLKTDRRALGHN